MYVEGVHCLDELIDYIQTSFSIRQNSNVEEKVNQIEDPISLKVVEIKNEESKEEFYLYDIDNEEISKEGEILIENVLVK